MFLWDEPQTGFPPAREVGLKPPWNQPQEGADRLIDELAKKYLDADSYPFRDPAEVRVTLKILPERINEVGLEEE
jgi:hypothetical protein